ncbi:MAG: alginate O-acetyltransferase complex protein AlgI [Thermoanaerobaculia bacterium]|jgi:D-alanyl-lipoteichoic acid acyltransferase DltB (MBOAT superfamily)|nr:alginate O-acetyltransferase complex protein AlgI [Thermoanaerobaculia bacterium]
MLFNTWTFAVFAPTFAFFYFLTRGRARLCVMLAGSFLFYAWWDWRFLFLLLFTTVAAYALGLPLASASDPLVRKRLLRLSLVIDLGVLGFFKYFNFLADSAAHVSTALGLPITYDALKIVLPVGISFYVFKTMSYSIDVYRGDQEPERDLMRFTAFVAFFPELVAGPIVRASRLLPQMKRDHPFDSDRMLSALTLIASGYVRKVVIADSLAPLVDARFNDPLSHSALSLLIGVYFYAFQIYCDFSGYSNIAIGLARLFGFDLGINFDRPYWSRSFSEFWSRWHISLSSWLRDYLYLPLGGNRGGMWITFRNLMLTMLLGGLWHGAKWTFVAWGALHGLYLIGQRILASPYSRMTRALRLPRLLSNLILVLVVFHLTCLGWVFFRADGFTRAWEILRGIASLQGMSFGSVPQKFLVIKGIVIVGALILFEAATFLPLSVRPFLHRPVVRLSFIAACIWVLLMFGTFSGNSFIYFQF